jgi:hypothetical protein
MLCSLFAKKSFAQNTPSSNITVVRSRGLANNWKQNQKNSKIIATKKLSIDLLANGKRFFSTSTILRNEQQAASSFQKNTDLHGIDASLREKMERLKATSEILKDASSTIGVNKISGQGFVETPFRYQILILTNRLVEKDLETLLHMN